jgi:hypothetical protein
MNVPAMKMDKRQIGVRRYSRNVRKTDFAGSKELSERPDLTD